MKNQRGFTLPELLVVGAIGLALIGIMLIMIRPNDFAAEKHNAKRRTHLASILLAIRKYQKDTGKIPPAITSQEKSIGSEESGRSLCEDLVPKYIKDIPRDPVLSVSLTDSTCDAPSDQLFVTGYTAWLDGGRVVLTAPGAEKNEIIEIEQWFPLLKN